MSQIFESISGQAVCQICKGESALSHNLVELLGSSRKHESVFRFVCVFISSALLNFLVTLTHILAHESFEMHMCGELNSILQPVLYPLLQPFVIN